MSVKSPLSEPGTGEEYLSTDKLVEEQKKSAFNLVFEYVRGEEILGNVDFSELIVPKNIIEDLGEEGVVKNIHISAPILIGEQVELKPGDIEYINGIKNRTLTEEDLLEIKRNSGN